MPPVDKSSTARRVLQPACDACHVRRVKCSHDMPCAHCSRLGLTCTYAKAQTAKKTAGKRIEALRQAERTRQDHSSGVVGGGIKREDSWNGQAMSGQGAHMSSSSASGSWNQAGGPPGGANGTGYGGHANMLPDPRHLHAPLLSAAENEQQQQQQRSMHHLYANAPPPSGLASLGSINGQAGSGNSWGGHQTTSSAGLFQSPRGRSSHSFEADRQVRFHQPQSYRHPSNADSSGSGPMTYGGMNPGDQHQHPHQASHMHHQQQQQPHHHHHHHISSASMDNSTAASAPHEAMSHYRSSSSSGGGGGGGANDMSTEPYYLPSPSQFFSNRSAYDPSSSNDATGGVDASTSTSAMPFDTALGSANYLQTSILPPFSTSMADSLFNNQGAFQADNIFNDTSLPPLVNTGHGQQTVLDMLGACLPSSETPGSVDSASVSAMDTAQGGFGNWPEEQGMAGSSGGASRVEGGQEPESHPLSDSVLIPTLALFYERLGGVMPVFSRSWVFTRLDRDDHHSDPHFASMLMAMSALTMIQAQPNMETKDKKADRVSSRKRRVKATRLLTEALRLREGPTLGQHSSLEMCCTSFFIFATLFGLGEHAAAWYRLRESITLAHLCRLHEPAAYEGLPKDEAERRLRTYWLLAITERAFAIQRGMPIVLTGNPRASTASLRAKLGFKELSDFPDLQLRLFDHVDEKFVDCWNRKCQGPGCPNFDAERAIALWRAFTDGINQPSSRDRSVSGEERTEEEEVERGGVQGSSTVGPGSSGRGSMLPSTPVQRRQIQRADVEVTRHWLLNRLWLITLNHGLLSIDAKYPPLRVDHAIHVAQSVYDVCDSLSLSAMEAHGVGFTYKLYDITQTLVLLCKDEMIAEAISKGGVGEQLEKQTTAAHTSGRSHSDAATAPASSTSSKAAVELTTHDHLGFGHVYGDGYDDSFINATRGPASLRRTVLGILNEFLTLFQRFRGGDHPYLDKLIDLINELRNDMDPTGPPSTMSDANGASIAASLLGGSGSSDAPSLGGRGGGGGGSGGGSRPTTSTDEATAMPDSNSSIDTMISRHSVSNDRMTM